MGPFDIFNVTINFATVIIAGKLSYEVLLILSFG